MRTYVALFSAQAGGLCRDTFLTPDSPRGIVTGGKKLSPDKVMISGYGRKTGIPEQRVRPVWRMFLRSSDANECGCHSSIT